MVISEKIRRIYGKLFVGGSWKIAYKVRDNNSPYILIDAPEGTWIADPMLCENNGQHYLFVELFDKKLDKAAIAYYQFINGKPVFQRIVIDQPYHLSYPCIFQWNGTYYMIPESAAGNTLDLYKAEHFPNDWKWECNLVKNEKYVDTTVVEQGGDLYALGYHKSAQVWALTLFRLDMEEKTMSRITEEFFQKNIGRPAGNIIQDKMIRPAQDCSCVYGESVIWYQIDQMDESGFQEHPVGNMRVTDLQIPGQADRVHTYSRDKLYEAVDLRYGKFELFHGFKTIRRAVKGARSNKTKTNHFNKEQF